jgi:hypothetical protein
MAINLLHSASDAPSLYVTVKSGTQIISYPCSGIIPANYLQLVNFLFRRVSTSTHNIDPELS